MEALSISQQRAVMPSGTNRVLDRRTLESDFASLIPLIKKGSHVLDVGCGSGSITNGIAERVGVNGSVIGIDSNAELIEIAKANFKTKSNLTFINQNLFDYDQTQKFDLIASARTLQWLSNPLEALAKMKSLLKPGGALCILDYNHEKIQWQPAIPESMNFFYARFLSWRSDAGMNNAIADDLPAMFASLGLSNVQVTDANELDSIEDVEFMETAGIWNKVVETRGHQMVRDGYVTEAECLRALNDYSNWLENDGQSMNLYLRAVTGHN